VNTPAIERLRKEYADLTKTQKRKLRPKCTKREQEVLDLALQGVTAHKISEIKGVTPSNVRHCLGKICQRIESLKTGQPIKRYRERPKSKAGDCERISPEVWARIRAAGVPV
jgi:DNA-binding NarL/FixJ family response regulator